MVIDLKLNKPYGNSVINLDLPWPPSINHYWRHTKNGHYISDEGKKYRQDVNYLCFKAKRKFSETERLSIIVDAYPPDKRKRDIDNILKSLLDALQYAEVYHDDSQIDRISITRNKPLEGRITVTIGAF